MEKIESFQYQGIRSDLGDKLLSEKYFFDMLNFNQDDIVGANKVLAPAGVNRKEFVRSNPIDGIFGYISLDEENKIKKEEIIVSGGSIFKNFLQSKEIYSGLQVGLCDFAIHMDELYITNGKDNIKIYNGKTFRDMGACEAIVQEENGGADGEYYYEVTFITAGGEERTGAKSNKVTAKGKDILLNLPIGYSGVNARKVYRAHVETDELKLVAQIQDNETLTFTDSAADSELTVFIPKKVTNPFPKPYFLETQNFKLIGCVSDEYPTQMFVSDVNVKMFDTANFADVSNRAKDNSALVGMKKDYDKLIVASKKQIYIVDVTGEKTSVTETRTNVGCLNGRSMARVPSEGSFNGGILFLAQDKTIRLFNGNFAQPVASSIDNLNTVNYGQPIKKLLEKSITENTHMYAEYFDFKYHLILGTIILVFDIRTQAWLKYDFSNNILNNGFFDKKHFNPDFFMVGIPTRAAFNCLFVVDDKFYIGRKDASYLEKMYTDNLYRGTDIRAKLEFPFWGTDNDLKYFKEVIIFYIKNPEVDCNVTVDLGNGYKFSESLIDKSGGYFDSRAFSSTFFQVGEVTEDYKVIYVNQYSNWLKIVIDATKGNFKFRGLRINYDTISNKEMT